MNQMLGDGSAVPLPVPVLRAVVHGSRDGQAGGTPQVEAAVLLLGPAGQARSPGDLVSTARPRHPSGAARQLPTQRHREGFMTAAEVALDRLDASVRCVVLAVSSQGAPLAAAGALQLTLWDTTGDSSLAVVPLAVTSAGDNALVCGEVHRAAAGWEFHGVQRGFTGGLPELVAGYGLTPARPSLPPVPPPMPTHRPDPGVPRPATDFALPPQGPQFRPAPD